MHRADFLYEWAQMSFEERAGFLRVVIEEECIDRGVPIPDIRVLDSGAIGPVTDPDTGKTSDAFIYGSTDIDKGYETGVVTIFVDSFINGAPQIDNPWEAVGTAFHEAGSHWARFAEGSSPSLYESEKAAESYREVATENFKKAVDDFDNTSGQGIWQVPIKPE